MKYITTILATMFFPLKKNGQSPLIPNLSEAATKENDMKCNMGKTDRIARIILGACIIAIGVYFQSLWGAIGVVLILTAAIGWCPAYVPFGVSSCKKQCCK